MFSNKVIKCLAIAVPVALALGNKIPSNIFLSVATILAFFAFFLASQGNTAAHRSLRTTSLVSLACAVMAAPVVVFDTFFINEPEKTMVANVFESLTMVTPYFVFFISIVYALYASGRMAMAWKESKPVPKPKAATK